ncbi:unnamed protein product [Ophioblennius macclurei]
MSFGNSNMAGSVPGATFSLLLLASIIQGFQVGPQLHYDEKAVVGQNITLNCSIKTHTGLEIIAMEWRNKNDEKLVVHTFKNGAYYHQQDLSLKVEDDNENHMVFFNLHLSKLKKKDSGTYVCDISTFPFGSIRTEIDLTVEDEITIECNVQKTVEVYNGENVTIDCKASIPNAQYRWDKNKNAVSDNESLQLWMVTDANAGIYTLTVDAGRKTLHKEFIIMVLPATTSWRTVPSQPQTETTTQNLKTSTKLTTSDKTTGTVTTALEELSTASMNSPHSTVTSSPTPRTDTPSYGRTTTQEIGRNQTELYTLSTRTEEFSSFGNISDESETPDATTTVSYRSTTSATEEMVEAKEDAERGHLLLLLILIPVLLLIAVAGILYRRRVIKSRMDLPPPFKPPPPPVKYTAPRQTSAQRVYT